METLNLVIALTGMIGSFVFPALSCHLSDNEEFYTQQTQVALARTNIIIGVIALVASGYTMITMQFEAVDQDQFVANMVCVILATLILGGMGWFLASLTALPILREARQKRSEA